MRHLPTSLALALSLSLGALPACEADKPRPTAEVAPPTAPAAPRVPTVVFLTEGGEIPVHVDVARTPAEKEKGLMFVERLDEGRGMLFLMGPERVLTFWMKNTYIPLDMIFLDGSRTVVGVVESAEPLTLDPRRVEAPSSYVVEVNGGWAQKVGIRPGVKARFDNVD